MNVRNIFSSGSTGTPGFVDHINFKKPTMDRIKSIDEEIKKKAFRLEGMMTYFKETFKKEYVNPFAGMGASASMNFDPATMYAVEIAGQASEVSHLKDQKKRLKKKVKFETMLKEFDLTFDDFVDAFHDELSERFEPNYDNYD